MNVRPKAPWRILGIPLFPGKLYPTSSPGTSLRRHFERREDPRDEVGT